jgi:alpha-mannosidase
MHFRDGFKDRNSERFMLLTRIGKLISALRSEYYYSESFNPGPFMMLEGLYTYDETKDMQWKTFDGTRERWGGPNKNVWFKHTFEIPPSMDGKIVHYDCNLTDNSGWYWGAPQALAYVNGKAVTGMDVNHRFIELTRCAKSGDTYEVAICAFTDRFFYRGQVEMNMAVRALNPYAHKLYYDLLVPYEVACELPLDDTRRIDIIDHLNCALSLVDFRLPPGDELDATLKQAIDYMRDEFYGKFCGEDDITVTCVGHTHIDTAWLWTLEQTRKKVARSFSTAVNLLERYDNMIFMSSQPQLYKYMQEMLPETYEKIKELVKSGKWETEGAMWVEADTNIPCGESLVRQVMHGKRFFRKEFGTDSEILWLPDVFGYSAALPQILKKSGVKYFMTTKISWNEYNKFPYDTFVWKGLDGSEVLAHFVCTQHNNQPEVEYLTTYNGFLSAPYVMGTWKRYQQKDLNREILFTYGYGDGGGGPTAEMVEMAQRMSYGIPGCPRVRFDNSLNFFKRLEKEAGSHPRLPVWKGELYFEYHRGTYTSIAKIKKNMRKTEILLQDLELFSLMRDCLCKTSEYPKQELESAWETVLLNQFHDIIPGSSIEEVYLESDQQFKQVQDTCGTRLQAALGDISTQIKLDELSVVVFNSTSFERSDVVEIELESHDYEIWDGSQRLPMQKTEQGTYIFFARGIPSKGYKAFTLRKSSSRLSETSSSITADSERIENDYFIVRLNPQGQIESLYHKKLGKDFVQDGKPLNRLIAMEDRPPTDDAWNINAYINEKTWNLDELASCELVECGPVRCVVRTSRKFMNSVIQQDYIIYADIPRIDVRNFIDWKEKNILLKADFPFDVNAMTATYDIQFGNIERSTTTNTSWDFAQFEVCAHRWADLSEESFGMSLLNDCKYGCDIKNGHMRLTLLKSAVYPNPTADQEVHTFTYSIYPHEGRWKDAETVEMAAFLNCPVGYSIEQPHDGNLPESFSLVSCDAGNVIIGAVKLAEDSNEFVIRLNEIYNKTTRTMLDFAFPLASLYECDLMEENEIEIPFQGNMAEIELHPFEIRTIKGRFM